MVAGLGWEDDVPGWRLPGAAAAALLALGVPVARRAVEETLRDEVNVNAGAGDAEDVFDKSADNSWVESSVVRKLLSQALCDLACKNG